MVLRGSYGAVILYILIAVFGYLTFTTRPDQLALLKTKQNILELDYKHNVYFDVAVISLLFTIMTAGPLCVIPCKDTCEDLFYGEEIMTDSQNISMTLLLIGI